ncbi:Putative protein FAM90A-like [Fukomys damarensis]|uniref:Zinc knuckle domain-containing protein n=1 Tax=Fukomys damarensis TaxID=885580 RepID=A0A091E1S4_FUKDA|nr:Putative protein FAM90A-like [Fukomys damarensis]
MAPSPPRFRSARGRRTPCGHRPVRETGSGAKARGRPRPTRRRTRGAQGDAGQRRPDSEREDRLRDFDLGFEPRSRVAENEGGPTTCRAEPEERKFTHLMKQNSPDKTKKDGPQHIPGGTGEAVLETINMLTERWEVVASVEALLRFPLMPGEDPAARCAAKRKRQPSAEQPHRVSQTRGDPKERSRKPNNKPVSSVDQKAKHMGQMPGLERRPQWAQGPPVKKVLKGQQRRAVGPKVLPAEQEGTTVKCKNCGAFGHAARSKRCPMKTWGGLLPFRPLGARKKENLNPRGPQQFQTPGLISQMDREKEQSTRQEELRRGTVTLPLPNSSHEMAPADCSESTEPCAFLRKPTRPMPVHTTKKRSALAPIHTGAAPIKTPDVRFWAVWCGENTGPQDAVNCSLQITIGWNLSYAQPQFLLELLTFPVPPSCYLVRSVFQWLETLPLCPCAFSRPRVCTSGSL